MPLIEFMDGLDERKAQSDDELRCRGLMAPPWGEELVWAYLYNWQL
jgi:hypothetical protein